MVVHTYIRTHNAHKRVEGVGWGTACSIANTDLVMRCTCDLYGSPTITTNTYITSVYICLYLATTLWPKICKLWGMVAEQLVSDNHSIHTQKITLTSEHVVVKMRVPYITPLEYTHSTKGFCRIWRTLKT